MNLKSDSKDVIDAEVSRQQAEKEKRCPKCHSILTEGENNQFYCRKCDLNFCAVDRRID